MFGLSFAKLLLLVAVVAVVWFGFRWLRQLTAAAARDDRVARREAGPTPPQAPRAVEDLAACPRCRAYVPAQAPSACERGDCPYPRSR